MKKGAHPKMWNRGTFKYRTEITAAAEASASAATATTQTMIIMAMATKRKRSLQDGMEYDK